MDQNSPVPVPGTTLPVVKGSIMFVTKMKSSNDESAVFANCAKIQGIVNAPGAVVKQLLVSGFVTEVPGVGGISTPVLVSIIVTPLSGAILTPGLMKLPPSVSAPFRLLWEEMRGYVQNSDFGRLVRQDLRCHNVASIDSVDPLNVMPWMGTFTARTGFSAISLGDGRGGHLIRHTDVDTPLDASSNGRDVPVAWSRIFPAFNAFLTSLEYDVTDFADSRGIQMLFADSVRHCLEQAGQRSSRALLVKVSDTDLERLRINDSRLPLGHKIASNDDVSMAIKLINELNFTSGLVYYSDTSTEISDAVESVRYNSLLQDISHVQTDDLQSSGAFVGVN